MKLCLDFKYKDTIFHIIRTTRYFISKLLQYEVKLGHVVLRRREIPKATFGKRGDLNLLRRRNPCIVVDFIWVNDNNRKP